MEEIQLRKYEHALVISGVGVIAFGLWSVIKATIYFILIPMEQLSKTQIATTDLAEMHTQGISDREIGYLVAAFILLALLADFALRLYIGRSAVADGRRLKKKRFTYVIWAMLISGGLVSNIVTRLAYLGTDDSVWSEVLASANVSLFVDFTSLMALLEMIFAAFMVRRLRRDLGIDWEGGV